MAFACFFMDLDKLLKEMGLNEGEIKVYLALLKNGGSLAGRISRFTGVHRRNVYDITERLIQKGVIGYIVKNNRRIFEAVNPEKFLDILKEKESTLLEGMPMLREMYLSKKEKEETKFYKGIDGLKNV
ncbi:MAG: helix-turn-helix domain-containing protein, partial [Nanoarchaeota archaeon]